MRSNGHVRLKKHCRSIQVLSWPLVARETLQRCVFLCMCECVCDYTHAAGSICVRGLVLCTLGRMAAVAVSMHLLP